MTSYQDGNLLPPFQYEPLDDPSKCIRLISISPGVDDNLPIHCSLEHTLLGNNHTCLSYTWGSDSDHKLIILNGQACYIRPNLYSFLHRARRHNLTEPIWIDAVCINQQDVLEKNRQVQMMGRIYQQASRTIVWLDLSNEDYDQLKAVEAFISTKFSDEDANEWKAIHGESTCFAAQPDQEKRDTRTTLASECLRNRMLYRQCTETPLFTRWNQTLNKEDVLLHFAAADYWRRAWIVQEIVLSKSAIILSSKGPVEVVNLLPISVMFIRSLREDPTRAKGFTGDELRTMEGDLQIIAQRLLARQDIAASPNLSLSKTIELSEALSLTWTRLCSNIKDRVFSILSFADVASDFEVDYDRTPEALMKDLVVFEVERSDKPVGNLGWNLSMVAWSAAKALDLRPPPDSELKIIDWWQSRHTSLSHIDTPLFYAQQTGDGAHGPVVPVCSTCFFLKIRGDDFMLECKFDAGSMAIYPPQWWTKRRNRWEKTS